MSAGPDLCANCGYSVALHVPSQTASAAPHLPSGCAVYQGGNPRFVVTMPPLIPCPASSSALAPERIAEIRRFRYLQPSAAVTIASWHPDALPLVNTLVECVRDLWADRERLERRVGELTAEIERLTEWDLDRNG